MPRNLFVSLVPLGLMAVSSAIAEPPAVLPDGERLADKRIEDLVTLDGSYFPFHPPNTREEWNARRELVRRQVLVSAGLWPQPTRHEPRAVVHGRVVRDDYTVERVYLESYPGHFVSGSLYRPRHGEGPFPAILSPHGHFREGRFHGWSDEQLAAELDSGGEKLAVGGRHPLQARCVHLARMGCLVFHYDMLGYADSQQFGLGAIHTTAARSEEDAEGFYTTLAELRLQSPLGLQLANSLYALDWLASLPEVDAGRIGVTGASGGGSQTFLLCAVDDRPSAAFPAVMVSTAMQGGCGCENACGLRVGIGNVELAALHAPKPLGMTSADDWTKEMIDKGYPELRSLYQLLGHPDRVSLASLVQFPHNYNHPSRRAMYGFFQEWLRLDPAASLDEREFVPLTREELTVWNDEHPRPAGGHEHEARLLAEMTAIAERQMRELTPRDATSARHYREVVGEAFATLLGATGQRVSDAQFEIERRTPLPKVTIEWGTTRSVERGVDLPTILLMPERWTKNVAIVTELRGMQGVRTAEGGFTTEVQELLEGGVAVMAADLCDQGSLRPQADRSPLLASRTNGTDRIAAVTYGYNLTPLAHRAADLLMLADAARDKSLGARGVHLLAFRGGAPYAAAALATDAERCFDTAAIDTEGFRFAELPTWRHIHFLPGAVKYGDLPSLLALAAPRPLWLAGEDVLPPLAAKMYGAEGSKERLVLESPDDAPVAAARFIVAASKNAAP